MPRPIERQHFFARDPPTGRRHNAHGRLRIGLHQISAADIRDQGVLLSLHFDDHGNAGQSRLVGILHAIAVVVFEHCVARLRFRFD